jgi:hypothetical protein
VFHVHFTLLVKNIIVLIKVHIVWVGFIPPFPSA